MITKLGVHRIEHQHNIGMFVRDCDNLVKNKHKQIMKINLKLM